MGSTLSSAFENVYLEYRAVSSTFSSALKTKHTFKTSYQIDIQLCIRNIRLEFQAAGAIFSSAFTSIRTLNIEIEDRRSVLHSTPNTLEYPSMGSTFSSKFKKIHLEYRAVNLIFSSAFKTKQYLKCELWDRHSSLHSKH